MGRRVPQLREVRSMTGRHERAVTCGHPLIDAIEDLAADCARDTAASLVTQFNGWLAGDVCMTAGDRQEWMGRAAFALAELTRG
jgi:hypothetical protein